LPLASGHHKVVFRFEPLSLKLGAAICLASLLILFGIYAFMRTRKNKL